MTQNAQFVIQNIDNDLLTRKGDDLICRVRIPLNNAMAGFKINRYGVDGNFVHLEIDDMIRPNDKTTQPYKKKKNV